jgi:hypothetical protein
VSPSVPDSEASPVVFPDANPLDSFIFF